MIYLDHAAATPVSEKALQAMLPYFTERFFNPSAPYLPAKHTREAYEHAKDELAHTIGAKGVDLVITAGATESINLAFTAASALASTNFQPKILATTTEHTAVLAAASQYNYDLITVNHQGIVNLDDLRKKLTDEVVLVSIALANNELGTIQPLAEVAEIIRQTRQDRLERGITTPLYLHSDASQALSLMDISIARLGVDLLTLNAAKCGGPKGIGALYVAHGVKLQPVVLGGGQERGLRSGTENVPSLIGFATAAVEAKKHLSYHRKRYQEMSNTLRQALKTLAQEQIAEPHTSIVSQNHKNINTYIPEPLFLGNPKHQLANFVPVCFPGIDAERLIYKLEQQKVYVSTGAACAANKGSKSHVLAAIGLSDAEIAGSLRISLGSTNTLDQIVKASHIIKQCVRDEYRRVFSRGSGVTTRMSASALQRQALATRPEKTVVGIHDEVKPYTNERNADV